MGILGTIKAARSLTPAGAAWALLRVLWPYLLGLVLLGIVTWKVYAWGYGNAVEDQAKERGELVTALAAANAQIDLDSLALEEVAKQARFQEQRAAAQAARADDAGRVAAAAAEALRLERAGFARRLEDARRKPACAALLDADLAAVCGL